MFLTFDWTCQGCGVKQERVTKGGTPPTTCRYCDTPKFTRHLANPKSKLDPISGDFPSATRKWTNNHIEAANQERKRSNYDHTNGTLVDYPTGAY